MCKRKLSWIQANPFSSSIWTYIIVMIVRDDNWYIGFIFGILPFSTVVIRSYVLLFIGFGPE